MFQDGPQIVRKRLSFPSVTIMSLSAIIITTVVSATGIAIYGLRVVDRKADSLTSLVGQTLRQLPEFRKSLPPALADAIDDVRRPDYLAQLDVKVNLIETSAKGVSRASVEITNKGDEVVSMLSMRLIGLDHNGAPISEENTYAATPLQIDDDWRGPLQPHETRRFPVYCYSRKAVEKMTHEFTDIRVWRKPPVGEPVAAVRPS